MIARRMRPIGWVAGVATAALSFYLVSLQVAAERAALATVERGIQATEDEIRHLETEFSARASLRQLEAYNDEVLALAAPTVDQYLTSEVQLASYAPGAAEPAPARPAAPATALAKAEAAAPTTAPEPARTRPAFKPAVVEDAKGKDAPVIPAVRQPPLIQAVAMLEPVRPALPKAAAPRPAAERNTAAPAAPKPRAAGPKVQKVALLDETALADIARQAAKTKGRKE